ncbi:hypothetical protein C9374_012465 [Naegleria lovaniensis]|uniref:E3 ubiquitin-protein ligase CCNB1IP1 n=1 Tax=Naegleria lovaniensis TaxID=51637 RepID=A0AA88KNK9_NAELO|nr:uncharacterized protein C9374_012465 [Naegleria lovaniensis]KAG2392213.1 hypothetical protein C9374_012465 [Naegleria lovaniensis]
MSCPACEKPLSTRDIRQVELSKAQVEEKTMCLCGLPPEVILEAAHNAFKFWDNQRQVEIKYQEFLQKDTLSKASQMEKSYAERLNDTKQKLQTVTERLQVTEEQYELTKREFQNIQEKYSEKVRERNKLQELYNSLKRKYEQSGSGLRSSSPSLSNELESHSIVSPSSNYKDNNQENIGPGNGNLLFKNQAPLRSSATSGLLDFRVSKTSPNALAQNSSTSGVAALLKSSSAINAGLNNTSNEHRSPLFVLGGSNKNHDGNNNGDNNSGKTASGFLFNRNEAHKLLYTPLKRSRPTSPRNPIQQFNGALLPSRRSPTSK